MKKILLIEDDPFLVDIYKTKLSESGFSVEVAPNGKEGLKKLREKNFDLLILDIVLPQVDGWQVLKEIEKDEKLKNLKIFVLSNLGQKEEVERGFQMGVVKYFIKAHYTPSEVAKEIKKTLK
jgi:DNA-binding response OmpR family regulator